MVEPTVTPSVRLTEVSSQIIPAEGVSITQALADAQIEGATAIEIHEDNTATVTWFKEDE